jgi:hypothetical protein
MRILAIIAAHNEGDIIYHAIRDLIENGIEVYLIDDGSTDNTLAEAEKWLGRGLLEIEKIPAVESTRYVWRDLLARKEMVAHKINPDWCIHTDADEFREAPWKGMKLSEAIEIVDSAGYNAIDFELLNFRPTSDSFVPGSDVRDALLYYETALKSDGIQIKAWRHRKEAPVDLVTSGGHEAIFAGRNVFPIRFLLRHYPLRSACQSQRKLAKDRFGRFDDVEKAAGWHNQYDEIATTDAFLWNKADLKHYDGDAIRFKLLDAFTREPSAYNQYVTALLEERSRLRDQLLRERAEVARLWHAERGMAQVEADLKRQISGLNALSAASCARLLAGNKRRLAIWGAGSAGVKALDFLERLQIDPCAFIDSDPGKRGRYIKKRRVIGPKTLAKSVWRPQSSGIFVASTARDEIQTYLRNIGWRSGIDFFAIPQTVLDLPEFPSIANY